MTERAGKVVLLDGGKEAGTFLDARRWVGCCEVETGLFSIAFPPDYQRSRRFYVYFTNRRDNIEVDEFRSSRKNPRRASARTRRKVIEIPQTGDVNHNGGQVAFGPDGLLYLATGDGGSFDDPSANAQRKGLLLGKLLRIDPTPKGKGKRGYAIPRSNPLVGKPGRSEIYARGLRNPFRFSFDGNRILIGDVGQDRREEVDVETVRSARGANFGWNVYEGTKRFGKGDLRRHAKPAFQYPHVGGACSIVGGYVVRDPKLKRLRGRYVYGDYCSGELRSLRVARAARRRGPGPRRRPPARGRLLRRGRPSPPPRDRAGERPGLTPRRAVIQGVEPVRARAPVARFPPMLDTVAGILLAGVLAVSAGLKLYRPRPSTAAMATFGFATPASRRLAWTVAVARRAGARRRRRDRIRRRRLRRRRADAALRRDARQRADARRRREAVRLLRRRLDGERLGDRPQPRARRRLRRAAVDPGVPFAPTAGSPSGSSSPCSPAPRSRSRSWRSLARSACCGCAWGRPRRSRSPRRARSSAAAPSSSIASTSSAGRELGLAVFTSRGLSRLPHARAGGRLAARRAGALRRGLRGGRRRRRLGGAGDPRRALRGRARARRDGRREGHLQQPRPAREHPRRPPSGGGRSACGSRRSVSEPTGRGGRISRALEGLASSSSRRGFLARVGKGMAALTAAGAVSKLVEPGEADGFHFCGHIYTTDSCPHPLGTDAAADRPRRVTRSSPRPASRSTTSGGGSTSGASRSTRAAGRSATPTAGRCRRRRGRSSARRRPPASTASARRSTAAGTAAAAGRSASSSTAARAATSGSTATPRSRATATRAARSSASCTSTRTCPAERSAVEPLLIALALAGLLVGATGTWSPCGFSMIETIGPTGHTGGAADDARRLRRPSPPSPSLGGALTFGAARPRSARRCPGPGAPRLRLAAAVALAAAYAEARGLPIVPQVRRQLPIGWRRRVPMPLAAAGYGVLLGLGFTTFVLSYGVWALMGVSLALGDPTAGLVAGRRLRRRPGAADRRPRAARRPAGRGAGMRGDGDATGAPARRPGGRRRRARRARRGPRSPAAGWRARRSRWPRQGRTRPWPAPRSPTRPPPAEPSSR